MIIFFGLAGSGKSVQTKLLSEAIGWKRMNMGAALRSKHDSKLGKAMASGQLVDAKVTNQMAKELLDQTNDQLILDGYPRQMQQAQWLIDEGRVIELCIVLDVSVEIVKKRLALRGRADDRAEVIEQRIKVFEEETGEVLETLATNGVKIVHIDGSKTIEEVHQAIMIEVKNALAAA